MANKLYRLVVGQPERLLIQNVVCHLDSDLRMNTNHGVIVKDFIEGLHALGLHSSWEVSIGDGCRATPMLLWVAITYKANKDSRKQRQYKYL